MAERPAFRSTRSEQPIRTNYISEDEEELDIPPASSTVGLGLESNSASSSSIHGHAHTHEHASNRNRSRQDSLSSYLHGMDLQYPALASLRDALLGYLGEAEMIVMERIKGRQAAEARARSGSGSYLGTPVRSDDCQPEHLDAAALGLYSENGSTETLGSTSTSTSSTLRRRGKALRRSLSGSLPTPQLPSPEALLAHLSAIREDVISSLPAIPSIIPFGLPSLPSRASMASMSSFTNLAQAGNVNVPGFLQGLPQRLGVLHDHLPGLIGTGFPYHHQLDISASLDQDRAASPPPTPLTPTGLASRLSAENRRRVIGLVKNLLPSEDWSGWEKLGWEDYDDDEDEEDYPTWTAPSSSTKSRSGLGMIRRSQSYKSTSSSSSSYANKTRSEGEQASAKSNLSPKNMIKRLYNPSHFPPSKPDRESEIEEEPEYLFPNKTPAAAMRRQQSYAVKREVRELRRARSVSLSALGERKGMTTGPGMGSGAEMRRTKSRDDGTFWKVVLTDSEGEDEVGRAGRKAGKGVEKALNLEVGEEEEEGEELEVEIEEVTTLDVGPTVHEALQKSENGTKLIVFDDLPWWMRNNEYVTGGYR